MSVCITSPSPVDVEESLVIVAVNHELVTTRAGISRIQYRTCVGELLVDHGFPFCCSIVGAVHILCCFTIAEIVDEVSGTYTCSRLITCIVHPHSLTTVAHQLCDSIGCCTSLVITITIFHLIPLESGGRQLREVQPFCAGYICRYGCCCTLGPFVIVHDLCHCCGDTTSDRVVLTVYRALQVIRCSLIPVACQ